MSESKLRILEVASREFMKRGYEIVKLKDLAEILQIKQPSLYYHFPDGKEQIYVEIVEHSLNKINKKLLEIISANMKNLRDAMVEIGRWAEKNMIMSPVVILRIDMPVLSEKNRIKLALSLSNKLFGPIRELFVEAQLRDELRSINVEVVTGMFLSMLEGLDFRINMRLPNKMEIWKQAIDILLQGILK